MKSYKYILEGLDCANCAKKIEDKIANTKGYEQVNVNFSTLKLSFQTDKEDNVKQEITQIVHSLEPEVNVIDEKEKITEKGSGTVTGAYPDIYDVCHADFPVSFGGSGRIR